MDDGRQGHGGLGSDDQGQRRHQDGPEAEAGHEGQQRGRERDQGDEDELHAAKLGKTAPE